MIGNRIAMIRKEKGWTQGKLAKASRLSRGCIAAIEGGRIPGIKTLAMIAEALGVEARELYREEQK